MFAVRQIKLYNFMAHAQRTLDIPERGLVLITGDNGTGKSSFVEAVAMAFWGETRRGTPPWRTNVPGSVEVVTDTLHVRRGVDKAHKPSCLWNETGKPLARQGKDAKGDTSAKAAAALEKLIPSLDVWAWSCVLSNVDTVTFSGSSNAERYKLLESMMGHASTDDGLKVLRAELAAAKTALATAEGKRALVAAKISSEERRIREADTFVAVTVDLAALTTKGKQAKVAVDEAQAKLATVQAEVDAAIKAMEANVSHGQVVGDRLADLQAESAAAVATANSIEARHKLCARSECPTCGQGISRELAASVAADMQTSVARKMAAAEALTTERTRVAAEKAKIAAERVKLSAEQAALRARVTTAQSEVQKASTAYDGCRRDYTAAVAEQGRQAKVEETKQEATLALQKLRGEAIDLDASIAEQRRSIARDEFVEGLLGVKGAKTRVIARDLAAITEIANTWMSRVASPKFRVNIKPFSEKGSRQAISLDVLGAGGGHGYKASSGGERKRIDLALMLALGDIARDLHQAKDATLFYDEAFDALDVPGREACVKLLKELAQTRAVVVVSHDDRLIKALENSAQRLHLE